MSPQTPFSIIYSPETKEHLRVIDKKYYTLIRTTIQERLSFMPNEENTNRKPLKRPVLETATWELRFGPENMFRVFYDVQLSTREVYVLAIGVKLRNRLSIGGEEIVL